MPSSNGGKPTEVAVGLDVDEIYSSVGGIDLGADVFLIYEAKEKVITKGNGDTLVIAPGGKATATNEDTGESTTLNAAGSITETVDDQGNVSLTFNGNNIVVDFGGFDFVHTRGHFTLDPSGNLDGHGYVDYFVDDLIL